MSRARDLADGKFANDLTVDTNTLHVDAANNRVGVGGAAPDVHLHVQNDTNPRFRVEDTTNNVKFDVLAQNSDVKMGNNSNHDLRIITNNSERLRVLAAGGITFNGDTAAANSLSDYEEGLFEPTFRSSDGDYSNIGYNGDTGGRYIKVGNLVYAQGCVRLNGTLDKTNRSTNSVLQIGGLPFANSSRSNGDNADGVMPVRVPVWPSGDRPNMTLMANGTAQANLVHQDFNGISSNILTDDLNSTAMIHFTLMYTTN